MLDWVANKKHEGWFSGDVACEYGAEIFRQLPFAIAKLRRDKNSRRAVIRMSGTKCLLSIQFLVRPMPAAPLPVVLPPYQQFFMALATFRSADLIYGTPADYYVARKLSEMIVAELLWQDTVVFVVINSGSD